MSDATKLKCCNVTCGFSNYPVEHHCAKCKKPVHNFCANEDKTKPKNQRFMCYVCSPSTKRDRRKRDVMNVAEPAKSLTKKTQSKLNLSTPKKPVKLVDDSSATHHSMSQTSVRKFVSEKDRPTKRPPSSHDSPIKRSKPKTIPDSKKEVLKSKPTQNQATTKTLIPINQTDPPITTKRKRINNIKSQSSKNIKKTIQLQMESQNMKKQ